MKLRASLMACAISSAMIALPLSAMACSTVIVGKDASATGQVIVGHNEDNGGRVFNPQYYVPPAKHKAGTMITFEPTAAKIPQVRETLGFYWSQTLDPNGSSFSDGFVNDAGVVIVSNACSNIFDKDQKLKDGGIGYGIRRLMAERAHSAREAVKIATDLLTKYGYFSEGRTYTIADTKEAWQIAIHKGNTWVARRVKDNEVIYIPNNFMMDKVDATDTENVIVSPGLIERSIKNGRYKPATPGVYNDFNFREAYQPDRRRAADWNKQRVQTFMKIMTGEAPQDHNAIPQSIIPKEKVTAWDIQKVMRAQSDQVDRSVTGWHLYDLRDIGNIDTHDSVVFKMTKDPLLTVSWRSNARPYETAFVPAFPLAGPAEAQSFMDYKTGTRAQFHATAEQLGFSIDRNVYTFVLAQQFLDWMPDLREDVLEGIEEFEKAKAEQLAGIEERAKILATVNRERARDFLHEFNVLNYNEALGAASRVLQKAAQWDVFVTKDTLSLSDKGTVDVVLFSKKGFDATKLDPNVTEFGSAWSDGEDELNRQRAKPVKVTFKDVNGDGMNDAVMTFPVKGAVATTFEGVKTELFLFTEVDGKRVAAFDTVKITK